MKTFFVSTTIFFFRWRPSANNLTVTVIFRSLRSGRRKEKKGKKRKRGDGMGWGVKVEGGRGCGGGGGSLRLWGTMTPSKWRWQGRETVLLLKEARSEVVHHRLETFPSATTKWRPHTWRLTNDWQTPKAPPKSHARTPLPQHLHLMLGPVMYGIKIMIKLALASAMHRLTTNSAHRLGVRFAAG